MNEANSQRTEPLSLETAIGIIRCLPDYLMESRHGIILDFSCQGNDGRILKAAREQYRNQSHWLEYYLLNRTDLLPELTSTWKVNYKPIAERFLAVLRLAQEVWPRSASAQSQKDKLPSPLDWSLIFEMDNCELFLRNSGFTGLAIPVGSRKVYERTLQTCAQVADPRKLEFYPRNDMSALEFLESEAALIARDYVNFRNTYYSDYLRAAKRIARDLLNSPLKGIFLLPDGSIQKMERGQGKKPNKRKSFSQL
ncbi:hypothetical protein [Nostoc sp.]|uniref:hypothetical protein n=1 Tax=Nostoc sp. TaxID=1180 RepID=UPI00359396C4